MSIVIDIEKEAGIKEFLGRHAGQRAGKVVDFVQEHAGKVPGYAKKVVDFTGRYLGGDQLYGAIKDNVARGGRTAQFLNAHPDAGAAAVAGLGTAALVGGGLAARKLMKKAPAAVKELSRIERVKALLAAHPKAAVAAGVGAVGAGAYAANKQAADTETKEANFASAVGNMGAKAVQYGVRAASLGGRINPVVGAGVTGIGLTGLAARKLMKKAPAAVEQIGRIDRVKNMLAAHPGATAAGVVGLGAAGGYAASRRQN